jgi:hypothetical protein
MDRRPAGQCGRFQSGRGSGDCRAGKHEGCRVSRLTPTGGSDDGAGSYPAGPTARARMVRRAASSSASVLPATPTRMIRRRPCGG